MSSISLRRTAGMTGLMAAALALLVAPQVQAQMAPISLTNATQLQISVAPNSISAVKQGGIASMSANGLTTGGVGTFVAPTLDASGVFTGSAASNAGLADGQTSFSYAISGTSADEAAVATTIDASTAGTGFIPTTDFGYQSGRVSDASTGAAVAISTGGTVTLTAPTGEGTTLSATTSTTLDGNNAALSFQRTASTSNSQLTFTAERQATSTSVSASGIANATALDLPTLGGAGAAGTAPTITPGTYTLADPAGAAVATTITALPGQTSSAPGASSTSVTQAGYGIIPFFKRCGILKKKLVYQEIIK